MKLYETKQQPLALFISFACVQITYNQESGVLLTYNSTSHIQKIECSGSSGETAETAAAAAVRHVISWNSSPVNHVVCAFPYILAFSPETLEFRYAVNGSLLQTITLPELRLISAKVSPS